MKNYHVIVLAMSTLPPQVVTRELTDGKAEKTQYQFKEVTESVEDGVKKRESRFVPGVYYGLGQLEAIPQFIRQDDPRTSSDGVITHMIILETEQTKKPVNYIKNDETKQYDPYLTALKIKALYHGRELDAADLNGPDATISHVEFFKRRTLWEHIVPDRDAFIDVDIDFEDPADGLRELQERIRGLYKKCVEEGGDWKLWLDLHGGFRDISMAMFGLMQVLSAPVGKTAVPTLTKGDDGIARLSDGQEIVPITGVYTNEFDPDSARKGKPQAIVDRTRFYTTFSQPALEQYMSYGQHMLTELTPYPVPEEGYEPFVFISYRRSDCPKERYALLGILKKMGIRYWYDDGIEPLKPWAKTLVDCNNKSTVFFALVSEHYFESYQCMKELRRAIDSGKDDDPTNNKSTILLISLDKTPLYLSGRICVTGKDENGKDDSVTIEADEMKAIAELNHLLLEKYIVNSVLDADRFREKLLELVNVEELIQTKADDPSDGRNGTVTCPFCGKHFA